MHLENVVVDATDPQALGRFWEQALGTERLTDEPAGFETRLDVADGPTIDLCFQRVPAPPEGPQRLHLDLRGGRDPRPVVERLLALGASRADGGEEPETVLADPEGHPFRVVEEPAAYAVGGPVVALSLAVADPDRELGFWSWLTGWVPTDGPAPVGLRHPSHRGPLLELRPQREPKGPGKNRMHLDVRLDPGEAPDAAAREIVAHGGRELLHPDWGDLPWRFFVDPSGNDFCVLPPSG